MVRDDDICTTPACEAAGKILKANLNETVDPCDDFYEFACGGWEATHTIPADKSYYFGDVTLQEIIELTIKSSLNESHIKNDSNSVIFASDLFKSCVDNCMQISLNYSENVF